MTGEERYWLHKIAVETGLRSNELRHLTRNSFDLEEPCIIVTAAYAKNRREASIPLRPDTAAKLRSFLAGKLSQAAVFHMPRPENVVKMLRADLSAAGIPYIDDSGRVCDFHALRGAFASMLLRSGVDVRTAKDLMRHSSITMTADVYVCTMRGSMAEAVKQSCRISRQRVQARQGPRAPIRAWRFAWRKSALPYATKCTGVHSTRPPATHHNLLMEQALMLI